MTIGSKTLKRFTVQERSAKKGDCGQEVGLRQRVPRTWGSSERIGHSPYLLVEDDDPVLSLSDFSLFEAAGFKVAHCTGPGATPNVCPLLHGQFCPVVDGADVVLHGLDPALAIAAAISRCRPQLPIVRVARGQHERGEEAPGTLRDDTDLSASSSISTQLHALRKALAGPISSVRTPMSATAVGN
jgi:hypothetical protein